MTAAHKRRRIIALVKAWQEYLDLSNWTLNIVFDSTTKERASCVADPEYRTAKLTFNTRRIGPQELDEFVCHEMCHPHGWALAGLALKWAGNDETKRNVVREAEELLVTAMSRAFLPLLRRVVTD